MQPVELGQFKNPMTSSVLEPATFRLVAYCLNQLRYRVPQIPQQDTGKMVSQIGNVANGDL
jgi:hypothetical protein